MHRPMKSLSISNLLLLRLLTRLTGMKETGSALTTGELLAMASPVVPATDT